MKGSPSLQQTVPAIPPLGDTLEFMRLIWAIDHGLQATSKRMQRDLGITGPQRLVIRIVGKFPRISAGQLADILHLHPSTLTGVLHRLVQRGLVTRKPDPRDGRRVLLGLTAKGRSLDVAAGGTVESAVERALRGLPARKTDAARAALAALATSLEV
jgi:MarR family transcriptional regulator, organic hydroperoxide resistance regulator